MAWPDWSLRIGAGTIVGIYELRFTNEGLMMVRAAGLTVIEFLDRQLFVLEAVAAAVLDTLVMSSRDRCVPFAVKNLSLHESFSAVSLFEGFPRGPHLCFLIVHFKKPFAEVFELMP